jgi:hypothetical protein
MVYSDSQCMDLHKNWRTQIKNVRRIKNGKHNPADSLQKKTSLRKTTQQETL